MPKKRQLRGRKRQFVRHASHLPIEVGPPTDPSFINIEHLKNVSLGGVAFKSGTYWEHGTSIAIRFLVNPPIKLTGKVVWCQQHGKHFEVGVEFTEPNNVYEQELVEKACQIEIYEKLIGELRGEILSDWCEYFIP